MAEGRGRAGWGRMASLMALVANVNIDPKKHAPFQPKDFNPYHARETGAVLPGDVKDLKGLFSKKGG
jgi:hypothetical protein